MNSKKSPAVAVAKDVSANPSAKVIELPNGARVLVLPVSAALIEAVSSRIKEPAVPVRYNEDKGREEEYPLDPTYVAELAEINRLRGVASMDAMYMFGIELVDGLPDNDAWLVKLKFLERHGRLDLSEYDLNDVVDLEFLYKRFVLGSSDILNKITQISGMTPEEVAEAETSFQGNA